VSEEYITKAIESEAIVSLLCAGYIRTVGNIALFTGGGNGCGKTTIIKNHFFPELLKRGASPRNMEAFYDHVQELAESGLLFGEYAGRNKTGETIWNEVKTEFPEFAEIENTPIPYLNLDIVALMFDEARAEKRELGEDFRITNHYYRALHHLPELCERFGHKDVSFIIDSTMSNPERSIEAIKTAYHTGFKPLIALLYTPPVIAVERAELRQVKDRKIIDRNNLQASQTKLPQNFPRFLACVADLKGAFLGLYSTDNEPHLIAHTGTNPGFSALNPNNIITGYNHQPATYHDLAAFGDFQRSAAGRNAAA
jgi:predicted ABC-type ATPase